jgi:hypothetical protein
MIDHPLFPASDESNEGPDVGFIHVVRHEGGQPAWCTYLFTAEELVGLDQIYGLFGGGNYELVARTTSKGGFVARVRYRIEGKSKPLVMPNQEQPAVAAAVAMPMQQSGDGGVAAFMPIMAQMMMAMMQQTTAVITAAMSRDSDSGKVHVQTMQLLHDRSMQSQAEMLKAVLESKGNGGAASEVVKALREGLELGREMSQHQQDEPDDDGGMMNTIGQVAEAFKMAQNLEGGAAQVAEVTQ